ncbi:MAG: hypothetical protein ACTHKG_06260 [Nocardioides sp.]
MTEPATYALRLTDPQVSALHGTLSIVLNDPDWPVGTEHDHDRLAESAEIVAHALVNGLRVLLLTAAQLRALHESLAVILNDPDWTGDVRAQQTLDRAEDRIIAALNTAEETTS